MGLEDRVVGVTDSCDYPERVCEKPNVACWFEPDLEKLFALEPDLVMGSESAHISLKSVLSRKGIRMILVNPATVDEALEEMAQFGKRLGSTEEADKLLKGLRLRMAELGEKVGRIPLEKRITVSRVLDQERDQLLVAGPLSFQYDVISRAGGRNVTGQYREAYPRISLAQFQKFDPEMIFFCGYDRHFTSRLVQNPEWRQFQAVQSGRVHQFHCGLTCRTGPRIVDMAELLFKTLYE